MQRFTWEELAESQDFEHGQEFVTLDEHIDCIALAKGQFDIVKMDRDRLLEALRVIAAGFHDPKKVALEALSKSVARE